MSEETFDEDSEPFDSMESFESTNLTSFLLGQPGNAHVESLGGRDLLDKSTPPETEEPDVYLDEQRRVTAVNFAVAIPVDSVDDLLINASKVEDYLRTGQMPSDEVQGAEVTDTE